MTSYWGRGRGVGGRESLLGGRKRKERRGGGREEEGESGREAAEAAAEFGFRSHGALHAVGTVVIHSAGSDPVRLVSSLRWPTKSSGQFNRCAIPSL